MYRSIVQTVRVSKPRHDILATSGNLSRLDIAGENPRLAHPIFFLYNPPIDYTL
jgi:hypothetical protein